MRVECGVGVVDREGLAAESGGCARRRCRPAPNAAGNGLLSESAGVTLLSFEATYGVD